MHQPLFSLSPSARQVTSLVSLRLLTRECSPNELDNPKYKCVIGPSTAFAVAARLKVNLTALLHEPELHGE